MIAQLPIQNGGLGLENLQHVKYEAVVAAALQSRSEVCGEERLENPLQYHLYGIFILRKLNCCKLTILLHTPD